MKNAAFWSFTGKAVLLAGFLLLLGSCSKTFRRADFSRKDVRHAQHMIGIEFSPAQIDTMYRYLGNNRDGIDTMRQYTLDFRTGPALYFDPLPFGFRIPPATESRQEWPLPAATTVKPDEDNLAYLSVAELCVLIREKKITSEALTRHYLERIHRFDPQLHAVITLLEERALEQARRADREMAAGRYRGPLHGIPYGIKDLFSLAGYPTTWGAAPYRAQTLDYTATVIEKLDSAGAVLVAKLTSGSLARGDVWYGGMTRNPWDTLQGASGSSAGSASAVAAGLVAFAIGTETLGSIVSPSGRCGVTGLRPTFGRVSRYGCMTLSWSMDKAGPICRQALDCALVLDAIRGADGMDRSARDAAFNYRPLQDLSGLRIGYLEKEFARDTSQGGKNNQAALDSLRRLGAQLQAVELPENFPYPAFDMILRAESGAFFDELVRNGGVNQLVQQNRSSRANSLRQSRFIPAVEYLQANRHRADLIEAMQKIFAQYDVLVVPPNGGRQLLITNLTGHPALAMPTGYDDKGRPSSITLLGNLYDEATILAVGNLFQSVTAFDGAKPPLFR